MKVDPCRERWIALGAPKSEVPGINDLVADAIYLSVCCSVETRQVIFDFDISDGALLAAYYSPWASDLERTWLYAMLSLTIEGRASVMAASEGYWEPKSGTVA